MKKHFIEVKNNLLESTSRISLCLMLAYSNIARTYETLLTYDLRIRNTDLCFHLVSCHQKYFLSLKWKMLFLMSGNLLYVIVKICHSRSIHDVIGIVRYRRWCKGLQTWSFETFIISTTTSCALKLQQMQNLLLFGVALVSCLELIFREFSWC